LSFFIYMPFVICLKNDFLNLGESLIISYSWVFSNITKVIIKTFSLKKGVNIIQFLFTSRKVCLFTCLRQTKVLNWIVKQCLRFNLFDNLKGETFCSSIKNPKWSHFPLQPPKSTMIQIMVQILSLKIGDWQPFPPQGSL
jgi:hypothetical protein